MAIHILCKCFKITSITEEEDTKDLLQIEGKLGYVFGETSLNNEGSRYIVNDSKEMARLQEYCLEKNRAYCRLVFVHINL